MDYFNHRSFRDNFIRAYPPFDRLQQPRVNAKIVAHPAIIPNFYFYFYYYLDFAGVAKVNRITWRVFKNMIKSWCGDLPPLSDFSTVILPLASQFLRLDQLRTDNHLLPTPHQPLTNLSPTSHHLLPNQTYYD